MCAIYRELPQNFSLLLKKISKQKELHKADPRKNPPPMKLLILTATLTDHLKKKLADQVDAAGLTRGSYHKNVDTTGRVTEM